MHSNNNRSNSRFSSNSSGIGGSEFDVRYSFRRPSMEPSRILMMKPQSLRYRPREHVSIIGHQYHQQRPPKDNPKKSVSISRISNKSQNNLEMASTTSSSSTPTTGHHRHHLNNNNPEAKLSILAQYDDMCRFSNSLVLSSDDLEKIIKHFEKYEELRENYVAALKDLTDKDTIIAKMQEKIDYLTLHLKSVRAGYCREVESKANLQRQYNDLRKKLEQVRDLIRTEETEPKVLAMSVLKNLDTMDQQMDVSDDGLLFDKSNDEIEIDQPVCKAPKVAKIEVPKTIVPKPPSPPPPPVNNNVGNMKRIISHHPIKPFDAISEASNEDPDRELLNTGFITTGDEKPFDSAPSSQSIQTLVSQHRLSSHLRNNRVHRTNSKLEPDRLNTRNHRFQEKKAFKSTTCSVCNKNIKFCSSYSICVECRGVVHINCQHLLPKPCLPIVFGESVRNMISGVKGRLMMIADFTVKDTRPCVPALLIHCCNEIDRRVNDAMKEYADRPDESPVVGLYRVCTIEREVRELRNKILQSKHGMPKLNDINDVHVICGAVKLFLRDLDDPLVTRILWYDFVRAADRVMEATKIADSGFDNDSSPSSDEDSAPMIVLKHVIMNLPVANKDSLAFLMLHLRNIAKAERVTKMTIQGLTSIFAPTIVGNSEARQLSSSTLMKENTRQLMVMEALFRVDEAFWNSLLKDQNFSPFQNKKENDCLRSVASFGIQLAKISASNLKSLVQQDQPGPSSARVTKPARTSRIGLSPDKVPISSFVDNIHRNRESIKARLNNVLY